MTTDQRREIKVDGDLNPHFNQQEVRFNSTQRLKTRPKQKGVNVKFIAIGMMVVGLVGFGVLTAVQYFAPDAGQVAEVPVLKADEKPDRIVPDEKGGVEIPHRDKAIFTRLKPGAGVNVEEVIIQEPEKPIVQKRDAIPSETTEAEKLSGPSDDKARDMLQVEHKDKPGMSSSSAVVAEKVTSTPFDLNKAIMNSEETQQKILDEDDDEVHEPVLKSVDSTPYINSTAELPKQVASSEPITVSDPISDDVLSKTTGRQRRAPDIEVIEKKGSLKDEPVANEKVAMAAPKIEKAAPASAPQAKSADAQFRVQLGSMKTREASKEEWARLQKMNPELRSLELFVDEVNIPEKGTFYRIQGGRITREEAASLCSTLKKKNTACFVVKG